MVASNGVRAVPTLRNRVVIYRGEGPSNTRMCEFVCLSVCHQKVLNIKNIKQCTTCYLVESL